MNSSLLNGEATTIISIGMAVYNCQDTLPAALRSILLQTYTNWELILIDDGSDDDTLDIAKQFTDPRIKIYISEKNLGLPTQLNKAIELSHGNYFARMDGDDISYPKRLENQLDHLVSHPEIDLLGTGLIVFDDNGQICGKRVGSTSHEEICATPWTGFPIAHPTYMGRMSWFRRYGYHNVNRAEDQDLLLRSYQNSKFAKLPEILLGYREGNLNLKKILTSRKYFGYTAFENFRQQGNLALGTRAIIEQILKGTADIIATASGHQYKILSHRAAPITNEERLEWESIWNTLQQ